MQDLKLLSWSPATSNNCPVLAVLSVDAKCQKHLKTYRVDMESSELVPGSLQRSNLDAGSNVLLAVPAPTGGLIVLGERSISYVSERNDVKTIDTPRPLITTAYVSHFY